MSIKNFMKSKRFRMWFGESKVVDKHGDPMVVYHGTARDFDKFEAAYGRGGFIYFTHDPIEAGDVYADREFGTQLDYGNFSAAPVVYPVYLRMERPFDPANPSHRQIVGMREDEQTWQFVERAGEKIRAAGFDGALVREMEDSVEYDYAVFSAEQIKSAIGNSGDFDLNNPDLCDSLGSAGKAHLHWWDNPDDGLSF